MDHDSASEVSSTTSLVDVLRAAARTMRPGDRLPTSRELVGRYRISPVTVTRAIAELAAQGVVVTRPGSGTYVAEDTRTGTGSDTGWQTVALADRAVAVLPLGEEPAERAPGMIPLDGGYLHRSLQPTGALAAATARAARRPDAWDRAPAAGLASLREVFAAGSGGDVTAEDVLVTAGGQSALSLAFRAIAAPGDPVLVESPTYPGALAAARAASLRPVPVPVDQAGVRPELLSEAFASSGARVFYCQPSHHNPTGTVLTVERRRQVVDIARSAGAFVIEDDFARFLSHDPPPEPPLVSFDRDGTVVQLTSLTKPAAPSMRIGALVARGPVTQRLWAMRRVDDFFVSRPMQEAALELLSSPAWSRHVRKLAGELRSRREQLAAALSRDLPEWTVDRVPTGGLHLWARLPSHQDPTALRRAAQAEGVLVSDGQGYFAAESPAPYLRLAFAAADATDLREATRRLAALPPGRRRGTVG